MGMGVHIPRIVSPITGEEEARPSTGYSFEVNEENMRRWDGWWKVANREQLLTFVTIGLLTLIGLSVLVASVLGEGTYGDPGSIDFIKEEAIVLGEQIGLWFEYFFYIACLRDPVLDQHRHRGLRHQAHRRLAQDRLPGQE